MFDVTGYFVDGGSGAEYYPLDAARVLDSRFANGLSGPFATKVTRTLQATGRGTVPVNAVAITGGAAVVLPTGAGWLIVGPGGSPLGTTVDDQPAEGRHPGERPDVAGRLAAAAWSSCSRARRAPRRTSSSTSRATSADRHGDDRVGFAAQGRRYTGPAMSTPKRRAAPATDPAPAPLGDGRVGRPADVQRGREPARHRRRDPRDPARRDAARRRRRLARRHRRDRGRAGRRRRPRPRPAPRRPSRASAGRTSTGSGSPSTAARRS